VTGALALGERPKAFRHRQEAAAELRTEIRLTLRKDTTARSQRLGGRASTRAINCGVFGMAERGLSAVDDYPQWTGRRIRIPLQGRRLAL
jgi:hypothetical protein